MRLIIFLFISLCTSLVMSPAGLAQKPPQMPPARVGMEKIEFKNIAQNQPFLGTLYFERTSQISSEVSGLIMKIKVREGEAIKNTVLVSLDTQILDKEILVRRNLIEQAALNIELKAKTHRRMKTLFEKGGVSESIHDDAFFSYQDALLKKAASETTLEKLLIQKRKSTIRAPFDGIILEKHVDTGDWLQQGKSIVRIGSVNDLFIRVPVAETLLKFVKIGSRLPVTINAYNKKMEGLVDGLSPEADPKTKNVFLKIRIPMVDKVAQNMSATVYVPTRKPEKLAVIPRDALVNFMGQNFVYTVKDGKSVRLGVTIITYLGNHVGASDDHFSEGMPVVVDGNERLKPGQPVFVDGEK